MILVLFTCQGSAVLLQQETCLICHRLRLNWQCSFRHLYTDNIGSVFSCIKIAKVTDGITCPFPVSEPWFCFSLVGTGWELRLRSTVLPGAVRTQPVLRAAVQSQCGAAGGAEPQQETADRGEAANLLPAKKIISEFGLEKGGRKGSLPSQCSAI